MRADAVARRDTEFTVSTVGLRDPERASPGTARLAMTTRAFYLAVRMRAVLDTLPGAITLSLHASTAWTLLLITAATDEAVFTLAAALELGAPEVQGAAGRWWCRATAEYHGGALRVVVAGPHHSGAPPR